MRTVKLGLAGGAALFIIYVLGGIQADPAGARIARALAPVAPAAAASVCPVPSLDRVPGVWTVRSVRCTTPGCKRAHLTPGDKLRFEQDVSGAASFSLAVAAKGRARAARTEGFVLHSDGVAGLKGPIVLDHDPLDGSPLDLHWLIMDLRAYDADGYGTCKVTGRIQICTQEPAKGATACSAEQHGGVIMTDPP